MKISLPSPELQVDFAAKLIELRDSVLQDALLRTVRDIPVVEIDAELALIAPPGDLQLLASAGLRGEIGFCLPILLSARPQLLGYYRLLLGYSQKEFYDSKAGVGAFKSLEEKGTIPAACRNGLEELCRALAAASSILLNSLAELSLKREFLDDLTLLTLGPQLRGGANNRRGDRAIAAVFEAIKFVVKAQIVRKGAKSIELVNASGRPVLIAFAADPDIVIRERFADGTHRDIVAIEVKGGQDRSNIHNRVGEAEKSHQKAKARGFKECWTVVNVDAIDLVISRSESPSSDHFFRLSQIVSRNGAEYDQFRNFICSMTGIPETKAKGRKRTK